MHGSALWSNPGGDFAPTPSASLTIVGTKVGVPYTWLSTPALVADVQGWLGNASTNHGWLLLNTDETSSQTFRAFYSREFGTVTSRPVLEIGYAVAGDANFDDKVDGADYTLWADNFLETGTSWSDGDFNRDGTVDGADYTIWADHYGPGPALTSAVPEPSTWALLAGACLVLLPALRFEGPGKRISLVLGIRRSAIRSSIIVLLLHLSSVAAFAQDPPVPRITAAAAEKHAGQRAEIEAEIVEVKFAQRRKLHFLSASVNFRSQSNLPVAIRADDVEAFHKAGIKDFSSQYLGKKIRAQGTVIRDEDQWLLVVTAPGDIAVEKGQPAASQPDEFEVVNEQGKGVKLSLTTAELPRTSITLDHEGVQETYEGVAVSELLKRAEVTLSPEARGAQLGRYVIVTGSDGYAAVFSVAEVDPYFAERPALLVDQLNGQPVPAPRGPVRLAVPSDKHRRRWVGQVVRIEVRNALDKPTAGAESK